MLVTAASRVATIAVLSLLALPFGGADGMAVHPVVFPTRSGSATPNSERHQLPPLPPLVVFLHGRLESDSPADGAIPRPAELYGDFCRGLAERIPPASAGTSPGLLLPDFSDLYGELKREPRDLRLGPISTAVGGTIHEHISSVGQEQGQKLVIVSYSMGAAILLKLIRSDPTIASATERLVLVEPVWRCWLPFAVSTPEVISDVPALALSGSNDQLTLVDSGGSVVGSLRPFLPTLDTVEIEGGNHFGIMSGGVEVASEGLAPGKTVLEVRGEIIDNVCSFCGWA